MIYEPGYYILEVLVRPDGRREYEGLRLPSGSGKEDKPPYDTFEKAVRAYLRIKEERLANGREIEIHQLTKVPTDKVEIIVNSISLEHLVSSMKRRIKETKT